MEGDALRIRAGVVVGPGLLAVLLLSQSALAGDFTIGRGPYIQERTIQLGEWDAFNFTLGPDERANWTVTVQGGLNLDIYLAGPTDASAARAGQPFHSEYNGTGHSKRQFAANWSSPGSFAILVTPAGKTAGNSTYALHFELHAAQNSGIEVPPFLYVGILIIIILTPVVWIFRAVYIGGKVRDLVRGGPKAPTTGQSPGPPQPPATIGTQSMQSQSLYGRPASPASGPAAPPARCPACGSNLQFDPVSGRKFCSAENRWL